MLAAAANRDRRTGAGCSSALCAVLRGDMPEDADNARNMPLYCHEQDCTATSCALAYTQNEESSATELDIYKNIGFTIADQLDKHHSYAFAASLLDMSQTQAPDLTKMLVTTLRTYCFYPYCISALYHANTPFAVNVLCAILPEREVLLDQLVAKLLRALGRAVYKKNNVCAELIYNKIAKVSSATHICRRLLSTLCDTCVDSFQCSRGSFKAAAMMAALLKPVMSPERRSANNSLPPLCRSFATRLCRMRCTIFLHYWFGPSLLAADVQHVLNPTLSHVVATLMKLPHLKKLQHKVHELVDSDAAAYAQCSKECCMHNVIIRAAMIAPPAAIAKLLKRRIHVHGKDDFEAHCFNGCPHCAYENSPLLVAHAASLGCNRQQKRFAEVARTLYAEAQAAKAVPKCFYVQHVTNFNTCRTLALLVADNDLHKIEDVAHLHFASEALINTTNEVLKIINRVNAKLTAEEQTQRCHNAWLWMIKMFNRHTLIREFTIPYNMQHSANTNFAALVVSACVHYAMTTRVHRVWHDLFENNNLSYVFNLDQDATPASIMQYVPAAQVVAMQLFKATYAVPKVENLLREQLHQCYQGFALLTWPNRAPWLPGYAGFVPRKTPAWLHAKEHAIAFYVYAAMVHRHRNNEIYLWPELAEHVCYFL